MCSLLVVSVAFEVLNDEVKNQEGVGRGNGSEEGMKGATVFQQHGEVIGDRRYCTV